MLDALPGGSVAIFGGSDDTGDLGDTYLLTPSTIRNGTTLLCHPHIHTC